MSFPLFGERLKFIQPDGTTFEARGWGDQLHARFETLDGNEVVRDSITGYYHYATTTPERDELRPTSARVAIDAPPPNLLSAGSLLHPAAAVGLRANSMGLPKPRWRERIDERVSAERLNLLTAGITPAPPARHTVGDYLGLCILVDFSDDEFTIEPEEVDAFCNEVGYRGFGNNGSVYDYFLENSGGRLRYKTLVTPYYRAKHPKTYYTNEKVEYGTRTRDLIKEALAHFLAQGLDMSKLTVDAQGGVFALNLLYAGEVDNNWKFGLWPHASRLVAPYPLNAGVNAVDYQVTALTSELTLGTYCHENGHMLCDFPDLYNYTDQKRGIGKFCLMCQGGNANQRNPVNIGGYLKYRAGWTSTSILDAGMRATADYDSNHVFIHSNGASEYFLIENRQQIGRDQALPASGLAVWHIDELGSNSEPQKAPIGHRRHECVMVQADGLSELDDGKNGGDPNDLFQAGATPVFSDTATPSSRWWNGAPSGLQLSAIEDDNGKMTFSVTL